MSLFRARYQDPEGKRHNGFPTFGWRCAPAHLRTRRQLSACKLRPVGDPVGQVLFRRYGKEIPAMLWEIDKAVPKEEMTPARWRAIEAMITTRRTCPECGTVAPYCLPVSLGRICLLCAGIGD